MAGGGMDRRGPHAGGTVAVSWGRPETCATVISVRRAAQSNGSHAVTNVWRL
jgi:hypothetical protein